MIDPAYVRCRATFNTARCSYRSGHYGPHYSRLEHYTWTMPGEHHVSTHNGDAA